MRLRPWKTALAVVGLLAGMTGASAAFPANQQSYIVVLDGTSQNVPEVAQGLARAHDGTLGYVYQHAIKGFSVSLSPQAAAALERNPQVAYVETDDPVSIDVQTVPTGIERIFADENTNIDIDGSDDFRVDVDVAVIDTGVDFEHPELNVVGGVECSGSPFNASCSPGGDDDHFHGTHVAGTIAAIDNGDGVVGVAPGARVWAVKVLDSRGSGWASEIVAGIDWVTANADTIEVANMSLGGSGFNQAEYDAIQGAVNAGVAFAVAAGNSDDDANNFSPAAFDNVLTVSALADFDGAPGGNGSSTCRTDQDDTLADFSNWGDAVQIAAPGVCILSTFPIEEGSYGTISGTSMASPHAAGALALLASSNNPSNATDVFNLYNQVINSGNFDWTDDSDDGIQEPLLDVTGYSPTLVSGDGDEPPANQAPTASFDASCVDLTCDFTDTSSDSDGSVVSWSWDFGDGSGSTAQHPSHTFSADGTYTVSVTVTDDDEATDSATQEVTVSTDGGGDETLVGSSVNNGSTWTAIVTDTSGANLTGTWDFSGGTESCADDTCQLSGIHKRNGSVTFTSDSGTSIIVNKP